MAYDEQEPPNEVGYFIKVKCGGCTLDEATKTLTISGTGGGVGGSATDLVCASPPCVDDSEVADDITASNYLPLVGGTITASGFTGIIVTVPSTGGYGFLHTQNNGDSVGTRFIDATDDDLYFYAVNTSLLGSVFESSINGESFPRFIIDSTGDMKWGSGSGNADYTISMNAKRAGKYSATNELIFDNTALAITRVSGTDGWGFYHSQNNDVIGTYRDGSNDMTYLRSIQTTDGASVLESYEDNSYINNQPKFRISASGILYWDDGTANWLSMDTSIARLSSGSLTMNSGGTFIAPAELETNVLQVTSDNSDPGCAAGEFRIWASNVDNKLKKCENGGSATNLDTGGSGAYLPLSGGNVDSAGTIGIKVTVATSGGSGFIHDQGGNDKVGTRWVDTGDDDLYFYAVNTSLLGSVFESSINTDSTPRFVIDATGDFKWGNGTANADYITFSAKRPGKYSANNEFLIDNAALQLRRTTSQSGWGIYQNQNTDDVIGTYYDLGRDITYFRTQQNGLATNIFESYYDPTAGALQTYPNFTIATNGKMMWDDGTVTYASMDTNLYRSTDDTLKTDDKFISDSLESKGIEFLENAGTPIPCSTGNFNIWANTDNNLYKCLNGTTTVLNSPTGTANGDLGGTYPGPTVTNVQCSGVCISDGEVADNITASNYLLLSGGNVDSAGTRGVKVTVATSGGYGFLHDNGGNADLIGTKWVDLADDDLYLYIQATEPDESILETKYNSDSFSKFAIDATGDMKWGSGSNTDYITLSARRAGKYSASNEFLIDNAALQLRRAANQTGWGIYQNQNTDDVIGTYYDNSRTITYFRAQQNSLGTNIFESYYDPVAAPLQDYPNFTIATNGKLMWDDGAVAPASMDTNLYRSTADTLKTDDKFISDSLESKAIEFLENAGTPIPCSTGNFNIWANTDNIIYKCQNGATSPLSSTGGSANGDLAGTYPDPTVDDVHCSGSCISDSEVDDTIKATNLMGGNSTTLLGSVPYQSNTNTTSLLSPNVSITKKFLSQTGFGSNGDAPVWVSSVDSEFLNVRTTNTAWNTACLTNNARGAMIMDDAGKIIKYCSDEVDPTQQYIPLGDASGYALNAASATAAGYASTIDVSDSNSDTTTWLLLTGGVTGVQTPLSDTGISYNSSTNYLTLTGGINSANSNILNLSGISPGWGFQHQENNTDIAGTYYTGDSGPPDVTFYVQSDSTISPILFSAISGETYGRFKINMAGSQYWGLGNADFDMSLTARAAGKYASNRELKLDNAAFQVSRSVNPAGWGIYQSQGDDIVGTFRDETNTMTYFRSVQTAVSASALETYYDDPGLAAETNPRFRIATNGTLYWDDGTAAWSSMDTNLARSSDGILTMAPFLTGTNRFQAPYIDISKGILMKGQASDPHDYFLITNSTAAGANNNDGIAITNYTNSDTGTANSVEIYADAVGALPGAFFGTDIDTYMDDSGGGKSYAGSIRYRWDNPANNSETSDFLLFNDVMIDSDAVPNNNVAGVPPLAKTSMGYSWFELESQDDSTGEPFVNINIPNNTNNDDQTVLKLYSDNVYGPPTDNYGGIIDMALDNTTPSKTTAAAISWVWADPTAGGVDGELTFYVNDNTTVYTPFIRLTADADHLTTANNDSEVQLLESVLVEKGFRYDEVGNQVTIAADGSLAASQVRVLVDANGAGTTDDLDFLPNTLGDGALLILQAAASQVITVRDNIASPPSGYAKILIDSSKVYITGNSIIELMYSNADSAWIEKNYAGINNDSGRKRTCTWSYSLTAATTTASDAAYVGACRPPTGTSAIATSFVCNRWDNAVSANTWSASIRICDRSNIGTGTGGCRQSSGGNWSRTSILDTTAHTNGNMTVTGTNADVSEETATLTSTLANKTVSSSQQFSFLLLKASTVVTYGYCSLEYEILN